jgi:hypothetical protein
VEKAIVVPGRTAYEPEQSLRRIHSVNEPSVMVLLLINGKLADKLEARLRIISNLTTLASQSLLDACTPHASKSLLHLNAISDISFIKGTAEVRRLFQES